MLGREFYRTPERVTEVLLHIYPPEKDWLVLDPCAGDGAITKVVKDFGYSAVGVEIQKALAEKHKEEVGPCINADFIEKINGPWFSKREALRQKYKAVVMNPPFSKELQFVTATVSLLKPDYVAALLPTAFLHSQTRYDFNYTHKLYALLPFADRIKFNKDVQNTPPRDVSWFIWRPQNADALTKITPVRVSGKTLRN